MPGDKMRLPDGYDVNGPPHKKENNYLRETQKFDQIVYFFDYLDDVFQKDISKKPYTIFRKSGKSLPY